MEQFFALTYQEQEKMGLAGRAKVERAFERQLVTAAYVEEIPKYKDV